MSITLSPVKLHFIENDQVKYFCDGVLIAYKNTVVSILYKNKYNRVVIGNPQAIPLSIETFIVVSGIQQEFDNVLNTCKKFAETNKIQDIILKMPIEHYESLETEEIRKASIDIIKSKIPESELQKQSIKQLLKDEN